MTNTDDFRGHEQGYSQQEQLYNSQQGSKQIKGVEGYANEMHKPSTDYPRQGKLQKPPQSTGALSVMVERFDKELYRNEEIIQLVADMYFKLTGQNPEDNNGKQLPTIETKSVLERLDVCVNHLAIKNERLYNAINQLAKLV